MKISSIPKSGRKGSVVYLNTRHGKVARQYVRPRNPRTPDATGQPQQLRRCLQAAGALSPRNSAPPGALPRPTNTS